MEIKLVVLIYLVLAAIGAALRRTYIARKHHWKFWEKESKPVMIIFHYGKLLSLLVLLVTVGTGVHTKYSTGEWSLAMERAMTWPALAFCVSHVIGHLGWDTYWEYRREKNQKQLEKQVEVSLTKTANEVG